MRITAWNYHGELPIRIIIARDARCSHRSAKCIAQGYRLRLNDVDLRDRDLSLEE